MGNTANAHASVEQYPVLSLEKAKEYDYILLIDQSGSMGEPSTKLEGRTKWDEAKEFTEQFARFAETVDDDGITVIKFNSSASVYDGVKADVVHDMFTKNRPGGSTNLAAALDAAWAKKFASSKKAIIVCVTDGAPDSQTAVEQSIVKATQRIEDDSQINLLVVQFGDDAGAAKFLDHLDNGLAGAKYDVVNAMDSTLAGTLSVEQLLFQAVNH